jgi:hypothetical protein
MSEIKLSFAQRWDDRITVSTGASHHPAVYRFEPTLPKPCFHPLTTPAGHQLTGFEMSDHVWHRGLWFAVKLINGTNFWEENPPFGIQAADSQPICRSLSADAVQISHSLDWTSQATGTVLRESRLMEYRTHASGYSSINWTTELQPMMDLLLDRTPYTTWGGYGGLSFRSNRQLHDAGFLLPNGSEVSDLAGKPHDWVMMHAKVDGRANAVVSLGMIDHPVNPRSPSPWYCKTGNGFNFMNAAFLFHEAMAVKKDETLRFRYRVVYRDGVWTPKEFQSLADEFRQSERS